MSENQIFDQVTSRSENKPRTFPSNCRVTTNDPSPNRQISPVVQNQVAAVKAPNQRRLRNLEAVGPDAIGKPKVFFEGATDPEYKSKYSATKASKSSQLVPR